jgi:hypothetical protein
LRRIFVFVSLAIGLSYTSSFAQQITGNLEGRVLDSDGGPLPAVNILVSGPSLQGTRGTASDDRGYFRVLALPVGTYTVTISHIAHQTAKYENISIRLGKTTTLGEVPLQPKTLEMGVVIVTAAKPLIDPNTTTIGANITSEEFEALPTERDFLSITSLLPQANTSFLGDDVNIAGSTGMENAYFIDGMNTTDPYRAIGTTDLPYNFVKEIEVKSGGYEAEYGRALGGIVNVITHSGSNEFQAKAFGFFTNNRLASARQRGLVELGTGDFTRYDAGLSFGGPIVRDKLWYFLAYNGKVEAEDITFEGLGVRRDKSVSQIFAGKLTWQPTATTNLVFSVFGDPLNRDRVGHNSPAPFEPSAVANPDPFLGKLEEGGINLSLKGSYIINEDFLLEAAVSRYDADFIAGAGTERGRVEPLFQDLTTGVWSGGYGNQFDRHSRRLAASLSSTYYLNQHILKLGFQFENNQLDEDWRWQSEGPDNAGLIIRLDDTQYLVGPLDFQANVRNNVASLFAQGSFALHQRLRLNTGLRWDGQYINGVEGSISIVDQIQPRVGFVLQPGELGRQKISGSFGRFYEQIPNLFASFTFGGLVQDFIFYDHNPIENPEGGNLVPVARPGDSTMEENLKGEHFDEFTLAYQRQLSNKFKIGVRGVYRIIREIIQNADRPGGIGGFMGNPGEGLLQFLPGPKRDYAAVEITIEKFGGKKLNFLTSYVLSRNYGNYTGLFGSDVGIDLPNFGLQFDNPEILVNASGLLPNDRTHALKFNGSYRFDFGLLVGTSFTWQRGTPLSELGASPAKATAYTFLRKRGTVGRTPSIWDLNLRLTYNLKRLFTSSFNQKLILDILHMFSQREPVNFDQQHFFALDENGNQVSENPNYLKPLLYQPPMTVRLGLEVGF